MKRKTIRKYRDFLTSPNDFTVGGYFFSAKSKKASRNDARYGIIAPKRHFKLATARNRAKRLLRDWIAANEDLMLDNMDYIFIARTPILEATRDDGRKKMHDALVKIQKLYNEKQ